MEPHCIYAGPESNVAKTQRNAREELQVSKKRETWGGC
jgi:hypothetical protein